MTLQYIDPVAGSIVIQAIVAAVVGGLAFFRHNVARAIRRVLGRPEPRKTSDE